MNTHTTRIDPADLSFGAPAAEREEHLDRYFFESESFRRLRYGDKTIVLGNRGAGKTAILKALAARLRGSATVLELAPDDYSYGILETTLRREEDGAWAKQAAYAAAWRYIIYLSAMKAVTKTGSRLKHGAAGKLYNYLRDNHANMDVNPIGMLISFIKRLEGIKLGKFEAGVKARELARLYRLEELTTPVSHLAILARTKPVIVLVDELDRGWDNSEDARAFVAGLFNASMLINNEQNGVRVILSLRLELYRSIPALFDDAQKYRDTIEFLVWDEQSLLEMIAKRLRVSVPELNFLQAEHLWNRVFSETLTDRQGKSFKYLVDRTLYRPRELIQFCELVRDLALKRSLLPPFNYDLISSVEPLHSEARLKDTAAEYRFEFPGLDDIFETFRGMPISFSRDALEYHCLRICERELSAPGAESWCLAIDPGRLIDLLWRVGFLRAEPFGSLGRGHAAKSGYLGPHQAFSLSVSNSRRFDIHPMFRAHLGMKRGTNRL